MNAWQYEIEKNHQCVTIGTCPKDSDLEQASKYAIQEAQYYMTEFPLAHVQVNLIERCNTCWNRGELINKKVSRTRVTIKKQKCPECKGHYPKWQVNIVLRGELTDLHK